MTQPLTNTEVKLLSLVPCEPPAKGQANDPFVSSSLLSSTSQMDVDDAEELYMSAIVRPEEDRSQCSYYKASVQLTTNTTQSSSSDSAVPQSHVEKVIALIELSSDYPLTPPQVLLTSRKLQNVGMAKIDDSLREQPQPQVDNTLKGVEQELNAGCVNFLEVPALAQYVQSKGAVGDQMNNSPDIAKEVMNTVSNSNSLFEAMDNILLLQLSLLVHMLAGVSSSRTHQKIVSMGESLETPQVQNPVAHAVNQDRRSLLANFYGRNFTA